MPDRFDDAFSEPDIGADKSKEHLAKPVPSQARALTEPRRGDGARQRADRKRLQEMLDYQEAALEADEPHNSHQAKGPPLSREQLAADPRAFTIEEFRELVARIENRDPERGRGARDDDSLGL